MQPPNAPSTGTAEGAQRQRQRFTTKRLSDRITREAERVS